MSLKTTPRGLLAVLAAVCIVLLQWPAMTGSIAHAARAAVPHVAAPAHHAAAARTHVAPRAARANATATVTFVDSSGPVTGTSATLNPTQVPPGGTFSVSGVISPALGQPVTVTVTDANGVTVLSTTTPSNATNGTFAFTGTLPATTAPGPAVVRISYTEVTTTATATFAGSNALVVGTPTLSVAPSSGTHCTTVTVTGTNFAPAVAVTPTLVYSSVAGITRTQVLPAVTPNVTGTFTTTFPITTDVAYSTTAVMSVTAPYTVTSFPTITIATTPTVSVSPVAPGLTTGPLGPVYAAGMANSLNVAGSGGFEPNSPITLTLGLSGTAASVITTTGAITSDATGAFTATGTFTPSVAGTYILTATDLGSCNVATTTLTVYPAPVAGPPVATTYFAEGYTGQAATNKKASYKTTLTLLNPNVTTVVVTTTYFLETINEDITTTTSLPDVVVVTHTLAPLSDIMVDAATDISSTAVYTGPDAGKVVSGFDQKFAIKVQTAGVQGVGPTAGLGGVVRGVAAERLIERTSASGAREDGDVSLGTTSANTSYYFGEGYTKYNFQEYLLLFNPSPTVSATVQIVRAPEGTATNLPPLGPYVLAPQQRLTLNIRRLNADSPEAKIGLIVNSISPNPNDVTPTAPAPIVAERTMYFGPGDGSNRNGETIGVGLTTAAKQLNFAYGSLTGTGDVAATITPTAELAQTQDDRPFVVVVNPNIAGQVIAGTLSGSASAPGPAAHVTIQLRGEDGRLSGFFITDVDAGARYTLTYNDLTSSASGIGFPGVPAGAPTRAGVFSVVVSSSERVVSELAQYYGQGSVTPSGDANSGAPGLALVGAPTGETDVLFPAVGMTDPASTLPLSQTIFLYNPTVNTVRVNGTFFGPSGVVAHQVYSIGPDAIVTIGQTTANSGGTAVGSPIPAGTTGAEFSVIRQWTNTSGQPAETFVAAAVTHSADATNWWGTQGLYPLPSACSAASGCP